MLVSWKAASVANPCATSPNGPGMVLNMSSTPLTVALPEANNLVLSINP